MSTYLEEEAFLDASGDDEEFHEPVTRAGRVRQAIIISVLVIVLLAFGFAP